jgi:cell division protein FtsW
MLANLKKHLKGDTIIWSLLVVLSIMSLLAVYSSTGTLAYRYHSGNAGYYIIKHVIFLLFGFSVVYFAHKVPCHLYSRLSQILFWISIPLLLFTLVFGSHINDASRWIEVPGTGMTFQTSDLAKLALIMYVARLLSLKQENIKSFKDTFIPIILPVIVICGLIMPANLSTAILLFAVSMILMFIGRVNFKYIALLGLGLIAILIILIAVALKSNWEGRWETWKNRIVNHVEGGSENNYQADQSKIAIVTGGIFGKGPGNSTQRNFLPHPYSDFIFAIIIEEYGLLGGMFVVMVYLVLLFRAGVLVKASDKTFPAFLVIGLTTLLVMQGMVNMAVAVGLVPVTGQPLPMISMGGTSILFTAAAIGIILSVSRSQQQEQDKKEEPIVEA